MAANRLTARSTPRESRLSEDRCSDEVNQSGHEPRERGRHLFLHRRDSSNDSSDHRLGES